MIENELEITWRNPHISHMRLYAARKLVKKYCSDCSLVSDELCLVKTPKEIIETWSNKVCTVAAVADFDNGNYVFPIILGATGESIQDPGNSIPLSKHLQSVTNLSLAVAENTSTPHQE